MLANRERRRMA